ncbi:MAG: hypothetical protein SFV54_05070 [Bryobacteraceae bacterium]|nr:hypothetical protein [Bryobacteraceae bacterium]
MRRFLILGWMAAGFAAAWTVFVFVARHSAQFPARQRPVAAVIDDGGPGLRILSFYANAGELIRGEHAVVCYGVRDAAGVQLDPPVEALRPALNRCFAVSPRQTTTYTLTAIGGEGKSVAASFTIKVTPPAPRILFLAQSHQEIPLGEAVTMCYGVANAVAAWIEPIKWKVPPIEKKCVRSYPKETLEYTLVAQGETGAQARESYKVGVRDRKGRLIAR